MVRGGRRACLKQSATCPRKASVGTLCRFDPRHLFSEGAGVIMPLVLQDGWFGGICSPVNTNGGQRTGSGRMVLGVLLCFNVDGNQTVVWLKYPNTVMIHRQTDRCKYKLCTFKILHF